MDSIALTLEFEKEARAEKVVKSAEFMDRYRDLKSQRMSTFEKAILGVASVQKPLIQLKTIWNIIAKKDFREGFGENMYEWASPKPSQKKDSFMSGMGMAHLSASFTNSWAPDFVSEKVNALTIEAFDACRDYAPEVRENKLVRNRAF